MEETFFLKVSDLLVTSSRTRESAVVLDSLVTVCMRSGTMETVSRTERKNIADDAVTTDEMTTNILTQSRRVDLLFFKVNLIATLTL